MILGSRSRPTNQLPVAVFSVPRRVREDWIGFAPTSASRKAPAVPVHATVGAKFSILPGLHRRPPGVVARACLRHGASAVRRSGIGGARPTSSPRPNAERLRRRSGVLGAVPMPGPAPRRRGRLSFRGRAAPIPIGRVSACNPRRRDAFER